MLKLLYLAIGRQFLYLAHYFINKAVGDIPGIDYDEDDQKKDVGTVYHIVSGPHGRWQYEDADEIPEDLNYYLVVKINLGNGNPELEEYKLWFKDEESADALVNHFNTSIEPLEVSLR